MTASLEFGIHPAPDYTQPEVAHLTSELMAGSMARIVKGGFGSGEIVIPMDDPLAQFLTDDALVKVYGDLSDTEAIHMFTLEDTGAKVLSEGEEARVLRWRGPGALALTQRGMLLESWYAPGQIARGSGGIAEPGMWRWTGEPWGAIALRAVEEGIHQPGAPLAFFSPSFNRFEDSNGVAWADPSIVDLFETRTFTTTLEVLQECAKAGITFYVVDNGGPAGGTLRLGARQTFGTDRSGVAYGVGVARFQAGGDSNIYAELDRQRRSRQRRTKLVVQGEGTHVIVDNPAATVAGYDQINYPSSDNDVLQAVGEEIVNRRTLDSFSARFPTRTGNDAATGLYRLAPPWVAAGGHAWVGDTVTVDTSDAIAEYGGTSEHDIAEFATPLAAIEFMLTRDHGWDQIVEVGSVYDRANQRDFDETVRTMVRTSTGHRHPPNPRLCDPTTACVDLVDVQLTAATLANGDAENVGGGQWSGGAYQTAYKRAGARSFGTVDVVDSTVVYTFAPGQVFTAGTRYVIDTWSSRHDSASAEIKFGVDGVDEEVVSSLPTYLGPIETGADGKGWGKIRLCWTPSEDRTGVRISWHEVAATGHADTRLVFDDFALFTAPSEQAGASPEAARCDHNHLHNTLEGRSVAGAHPASAVSVLDAADNYVGTNVETVLAELAGGGVTDHGALTGLLDDDHTQYQKESEKGGASGYASLDASTRVPFAQLPTGIAATEVAIGSHGHAEGGDGTHQLLMVKDGVIPLEPVEYDQGPGASVWVYSDQSYGGSGAGEHSHDHGALTGLADDDHAAYSDVGHGHDHGALTGLGDLDHPAYLAGETGKTYRTIAGVLEPTGAGSWRLVPTNHEDINVDSVTVNVIDANTIEINFGVTALSVVSSHVSADNTLVDNGYTVGCFTTLSHLGIRIYDSAHAIADPTAVQIAASNIWFLSIVRMS